MIPDDMTQLIGNTACVRIRTAEATGVNFYVKLEAFNPTASLKDRACFFIIRRKLERGELKPSMTLLDASSGNFACAVAYYGKLLGYKAAVVVNSKLTADKRNFLRFFGATIHQVGDFTIEGNHYCREIANGPNGSQYCFLDQLHNWDNPMAYYETLAPEIVNAFPNLSMVVGSLGSGGSMLGVGEFIKQNKPGVKVVTVQAASGTRLPGTASFDDGDYVTPFIKKGLDSQIFEATEKITEQDAIKRTMELREQGVFCGLQTGGVFHGAIRAAQRLNVHGDVVIISGDSGWKNMEKLLQVGCENEETFRAKAHGERF